MSSSSTPDTGDSRRGQTTPIVALVALFAVCTAVSLYATAVVDVTPAGTGNALADPTLERVYDATSEGGVVSPVSLSRVERVAPDGYRAAAAVTTENGRWTAGAQPPSGSGDVDTAARPVAVSTADGAVLWGRLRVWVWR